MNIYETRDGDTLTIALVGNLDTNTSYEAWEDISGKLEGVDRLMLDLKGVDYVSSSGLRLFLQLHKKMSDQGGTLTLMNINDMVRDILDITGFCKVLTILDDKQDLDSNTLEVSADLSNIDVVTDFIRYHLDQLNVSEKLKNQFAIVIDELFSNIAKYAYEGYNGTVRVEFHKYEDAPQAVSIIFRDNGIPFNPLEVSEPDVDAPLEDRDIGGLGIFLVRNIMDEVEYKYENNENILKIKKYL